MFSWLKRGREYLSLWLVCLTSEKGGLRGSKKIGKREKWVCARFGFFLFGSSVDQETKHGKKNEGNTSDRKAFDRNLIGQLAQITSFQKMLYEKTQNWLYCRFKFGMAIFVWAKYCFFPLVFPFQCEVECTVACLDKHIHSKIKQPLQQIRFKLLYATI